MEVNTLPESSMIFVKKARIKRKLTNPYNPQQNGVAKRKNITICEAASAMMCD